MGKGRGLPGFVSVVDCGFHDHRKISARGDADWERKREAEESARCTHNACNDNQ